jgi:adenylate cyclase class IV
MYEVEYKVELSENEKDILVQFLEKSDFVSKQSIVQNDYYIMAKKSSLGDYDFKRYREEGNTAFYTEKIWEYSNGENIRKEIEKEISKNGLQSEILKNPNAIKIQKSRKSFNGEYKDRDIHIDIDTVQFDHSLNIRYFVEAEIITKNKEEVKNLRKEIIEFLKNILRKQELEESPSMFTMAFKKI